MAHHSIIRILLTLSFFCAEDYQPFFDKAVTFVKEQASEDYVYTNRIEFKLVEDKV